MIALIHTDHLGRKVLHTHTVDLTSKEFGDGPIKELVLEDPGSDLLIPVPGGEQGESGMLIVGEENLLWVSLEEDVKGKGKQATKKEGSDVSARLPVGLYTTFVCLPFESRVIGVNV
jgi:DNA damage-binding protein 1